MTLPSPHLPHKWTTRDEYNRQNWLESERWATSLPPGPTGPTGPTGPAGPAGPAAELDDPQTLTRSPNPAERRLYFGSDIDDRPQLRVEYDEDYASVFDGDPDTPAVRMTTELSSFTAETSDDETYIELLWPDLGDPSEVRRCRWYVDATGGGIIIDNNYDSDAAEIRVTGDTVTVVINGYLDYSSDGTDTEFGVFGATASPQVSAISALDPSATLADALDKLNEIIDAMHTYGWV